MKNVPFRVAAIMLMLGSSQAYALTQKETSGTTVSFLTTPFPPLIRAGLQGEIEGYAVALLRKMHSFLHLPPPMIQVYNLSRSYHLAQGGDRYTAVFPIKRTKERDNKFKWVGPIFKARHAVVAVGNKFSRVPIIKKNLAQYTYSVVLEDLAENLLERSGVQRSHISFVRTASQMLKQEESGRTNFLVYPLPALRALLRDKKIKVKVVYVFKKPTHYYFAFNKSVPDRLIHAYQKALEHTKRGALKKVSPWPH